MSSVKSAVAVVWSGARGAARGGLALGLALGLVGTAGGMLPMATYAHSLAAIADLAPAPGAPGTALDDLALDDLAQDAGVPIGEAPEAAAPNGAAQDAVAPDAGVPGWVAQDEATPHGVAPDGVAAEAAAVRSVPPGPAGSERSERPEQAGRSEQGGKPEQPGRSAQTPNRGRFSGWMAASLQDASDAAAAPAGAPGVSGVSGAPAGTVAAASAPSGGVAPAPLIVNVSLPAAGGAAGAAAGTAAAPAVADIERALLDRTNLSRAANGLPPVEFDPALTSIARQRAAAQIPLPALSHYDASGNLGIATLFSAGGVSFRLAGENLARLSAPDARAAEYAAEALMRSPSHRKNILEPFFNRLAVGMARDASGRIIFAQIFRSV